VTLPLWSASLYLGVTRSVILAIKEEGRTELARAVAPLLLDAVGRAFAVPAARGAVLVPVPGSRASLGRRGFHPVELLARCAGLHTVSALRLDDRAIDPVAQKHRSLAARAERSEPHVTRDLTGRTVVLLDDVITSGATMRSAARALRRAGARVAGGAAIAATPRRWGESAIDWQPEGIQPLHRPSTQNRHPPINDIAE
jgi:predicted amidophosphoribosyltransferase